MQRKTYPLPVKWARIKGETDEQWLTRLFGFPVPLRQEEGVTYAEVTNTPTEASEQREHLRKLGIRPVKITDQDGRTTSTYRIPPESRLTP